MENERVLEDFTSALDKISAHASQQQMTGMLDVLELGIGTAVSSADVLPQGLALHIPDFPPC